MIIEFNALCFNVIVFDISADMFWRIKKCLFLNCFALRIIRHIGRILSIFVLKSEIKSYKSDLPEILNF